MVRSTRAVLRDLGRSIVGALLLGVPLIYTMETWWLAWRMPAYALLLFAFGGLAAVLVTTRYIGFHEEVAGREETLRDVLEDFLELTFSSFVAAYSVLLLFGILETGDSINEAVRLGLIQIVPLGLGAAIANRVLRAGEEDDQKGFFEEMAIFALGAAFFAFPASPTEEMELMAAHAGWWRLAVLVLASIVVTYLVLYELEFRGHRGRTAGARGAGPKGLGARLGETIAGYCVALLVGGALLAGYGHFVSVTFAEAVQQLVVVGFLASLGGAAARVVI